MRVARLLFPALRADAGNPHRISEEVDRALRLGVGGFILFGGEAESVRALTSELQRRSERPLLFGSDLERGAGQQFDGCTPLPPAAALASLDDPDVLWRAGELTGREAGALGVRWVYAPVADLANEPRNPIVGTRAFGADPAVVARRVASWILGCRAGGGLACVKHFPGHGRTVADSHLELPVVSADAGTLGSELAPFIAAFEVGVPSLMTAHVAFPSLDDSGVPATRSRPVLTRLLREELHFDGVAVTDALIMEGAAAGAAGGEAQAAVEAVEAGIDALLYPRDPAAVAAALASAFAERLEPGRIDQSLRRLDGLRELGRAEDTTAARGAGPDPGLAADPFRRRAEDMAWARAVALRSIRPVEGRPEPERRGMPPLVRLRLVDDDVGGPYPVPDRKHLPEALGRAGAEVRRVGGSTEGEDAEAGDSGSGALELVAVYADTRGWKGRAGLSEASRAAVERAPARALFVLFGHPRIAEELPVEAPVLCAWGGDPLMQEAAGRFLAGRFLGWPPGAE